MSTAKSARVNLKSLPSNQLLMVRALPNKIDQLFHFLTLPSFKIQSTKEHSKWLTLMEIPNITWTQVEYQLINQGQETQAMTTDLLTWIKNTEGLWPTWIAKTSREADKYFLSINISCSNNNNNNNPTINCKARNSTIITWQVVGLETTPLANSLTNSSLINRWWLLTTIISIFPKWLQGTQGLMRYCLKARKWFTHPPHERKVNKQWEVR